MIAGGPPPKLEAMNYHMAYALGFHPWEDLIDNPRFAGKLEELVAGAERNGGPHGRALDIGTGSGVWGVWLARRGWEVTGVDTVERALRRARERAAQEGVTIELRRA